MCKGEERAVCAGDEEKARSIYTGEERRGQ